MGTLNAKAAYWLLAVPGFLVKYCYSEVLEGSPSMECAFCLSLETGGRWSSVSCWQYLASEGVAHAAVAKHSLLRVQLGTVQLSLALQ